MVVKDTATGSNTATRRRFSGMRERLSLYFLLAVLVPLAFGTLVSERLIERHIVGLARASAEERLDSVAGRLEDRSRFVQMDLAQLATSRPLIDSVAAGEAQAATAAFHAARMPRQIDVLALIASDGRLISRTVGHRDRTTLGLKHDAVLRRAFAGETVSSYEELDGMLVQVVTMPVREHDRVLGALLGATFLTGNDALCAHLVDRGQGESAFAHGDRWVASSRVDEGSGPAMIGSPLRREQLQALAHDERWVGPFAASTDRFMAIAPLSDATGDVVGAVAGLVSTAGLAALQRDARRSFLAAMGLGALISLLLALLAARRMTGPLRRLAQAAITMQKGKLDGPVVVEGDDEVAQLALAFRDMARALSESMATLEQRVAERVRELQQARDREAGLNRELLAQNEQLRAQGQTLRAQGEELERQRGELVEKTRRSEEADRLKSAFIANMSHEIRTPLNSVLALSQLLRDGMAGALSGDQRKYLEVIERNGQNLLRLINDILDLSRIEAGHLEMDLQAADIAALIRATVGTLSPLAETKGLELHARLPERLPPVRCDVDRVRQILTNLIGNAIKFTEAGQVLVSAEAREGKIAVHVTDTGVGISDAAQGKVFQEFFQVDQSMARRRGGTGLGLAIASRLAHLMGGEITLESVLGAGSRFTLALEQATGDVVGLVTPGTDAAEQERAIRGAGGPGRSGRRPLELPATPGGAPERNAAILIVEDNEDNLFTLRQILAPLAVELVPAANGREAIDYCRRRRPDLIVMDMQMPAMSGLQATGAIRSLPGGAGIPIVALTAQAMKGDRERILAAGCDVYLSKPIQPKVLLGAIQRLLDRRGEAVASRGGTQTTEEQGHGTHTPGR
jgi:signal transduction histidine kinase/ActR/RegA family two-component response regulator